MTNSNKPVLTLFVSGKGEGKSSWTLDAHGRDTFRIVVVRSDEQSSEPLTNHRSEA
jgi:hypothetical protein